MRERMEEGKEQVESEILVTDRPEAIVMVASRRALAPTPHIGLLSGQELLEDLGRNIEVVDPSWQGKLKTPIGEITVSFAEPVPKNIIEAPLETQVSSLVKGAAAIEAAKEALPQQKPFLKRVEDKFLAVAGVLLKGKTEKVTAAASIFSLVAACTPRVSPTIGAPASPPARPTTSEALPRQSQTPTATETARPTPTTKPTLEPSPTPEGQINPERIKDLASKLHFKKGSSAVTKEIIEDPNQFYFEFISTGEFEEVELTNPSTNEVIGKGVVLKVVSKDKGGVPYVARVLVQADSIKDPGIDQYLIGLMMAANGSTLPEELKVDKPPMLSPEVLKKLIPEGTSWALIFMKHPGYLDPSLVGKYTADLVQIFYNNPDYSNKIDQFYNSDGFEYNEDTILIPIGLSL